MTETRKFSESELHEAYRRVINRLRKFYPEEIIQASILKLNEHPKDTIKHLTKYQPWNLLLLMKWTLLYGEYSHPKRRHLSTNEFNDLVNRMHDLGKYVKMPSEYDNIFLFFRNMAFQQFWLQPQLNPNSWARQSYLFNKLENNHPFQSSFFQKTGISISHFIELSLVLMTPFILEERIGVNRDWFGPILKKYPNGTIDRFLELLSSDIQELRRKISAEERSGRSLSYEIYEKTPFRKTPLLRLGSNYFPFSVNLLSRSLETFIYDTLRADDPSAFMNIFGPLFEKYVGYSISQTRINYIAEKELKNHFKDTKLVDFLLVDNESNIFVDAKGVEMSYLGMVGDQPSIIENSTRDSIIKGIKQGFETARHLQGLNTINGIKLGTINNYLLIITFKDMYVGNGSDFYQFIAKETLDKILSDYQGFIPIPFEHMYFMSVDDFDRLTGGIDTGALSLANTLERAVAADKSAGKKFEFCQHLNEFFPTLPYPQWLRAETNCIKDCCAERLKPS